MEPIVGSALFYLYVLGLCEIGRQMVRSTISAPALRTFLFEFLGTLQICACIYEGPIIMKYYGFLAFWLNVFFLASMHGLTVGTSAMLIPCRVIKLAWQQRSVDFAIRLLAEIAAAAITYYFVRLFWSLGVSAEHAKQFDNFACSIRYSVPLYVVGLAEMLLTMVLCAAYTEIETWRLSMWSTRFVRAATLATLICTGVLVAGGPVFMNPAQGLGRILACEGLRMNEHVVFQWILPTVGWWFGTEFRLFVRRRTVGVSKYE